MKFKLAIITGSFAALLLSAAAAQKPTGITFAVKQVAGTKVDVVQVPPYAGLEVRPALAAGGAGRAEPFDAFLKRYRPLAAINGTFFSNRSLLPVGYIVVDGRVLYPGRMGTAIAVRQDGGVDFVRLPRGYSVDWSGYRHALACGPTLVWNGGTCLAARSEGFRDPHIFAIRPRSAIGVKGDNTILLVTVKQGISLERLAAIMCRLGCEYAINLDGGGSVALAVNGKMIRRPNRRLTNVLMVVRKRDQQQAGGLILPRGLDWRGRRAATAFTGRQAEQPLPPGMIALRWKKGRIVIGPSQSDRGYLEAGGDDLPDGWHVELKIDGRLRGYLSPPCVMPMANLMPDGGKLLAELVDSTGRKVASGWVQIGP